jgi:endonuclease YncB( thermonuclease family)
VENGLELYCYRIYPIRVVDGDTILARVDLGMAVSMTDYIRFNDINTPETHGPTACDKGWMAKNMTEAWLKGIELNLAGVVMLEQSDKIYHTTIKDKPFLSGLTMRSNAFNPEDKYGRILGTIYRNNDMSQYLNKYLLSQGLIK